MIFFLSSLLLANCAILPGYYLISFFIEYVKKIAKKLLTESPKLFN